MQNIKVRVTIPKGLEILKESDAAIQIDKLGADETKEYTISLKEAAGSPGGGENKPTGGDKKPPKNLQTNVKTSASAKPAVSSKPSTKKATNATTGDSLPVEMFLAILVLSGTIAAIMLFKKKRKGLFMVLLVSALGMAGAGSKEVHAESITKNFDVSQTVKVDGKEYVVKAAVSYDKEEGQIVENGEVTREEWIISLVDTLGLPVVSEPRYYSFDDFSQMQEPLKIETAVQYGLVKLEADEDNMVYFKPQDFAVREFVSYSAIKALGYDTSNQSALPAWDDAEKLAYPREDKLAVELGMFLTIQNKFYPEQYLSKSESEGILEIITSVLGSANIDPGHNDKVNYADGVEETTLSYQLDEENHQVIIYDPKMVKDWKIGEIHVLISEDSSEKEIAIKITGIRASGNVTYITYEEPALEEVTASFDVEGSENTGGEFTPAQDVTIEGAAMSRAAVSGTVPLFGKQKMSINLGDFSVEGSMNIKEMEYRFAASPSWHLISIDDVYLALNSEFEISGSYMRDNDFLANKDIKKKLGEFKCPLGYGFNASGVFAQYTVWIQK